METNRLKQFCTIVETESFRKASELLGISHSGLSKAMKALEHEVGITLFLPSGRGVVVSDQGRDLYERCGPFFASLNQLLGTTAQKNFVRIGSFEVFTSYFMGKLLKDYLGQIEVEVHELTPGRLEEALLHNRVDLGITYEPIPRQGIEYVKVTAVSMGIYARRNLFKDLKIEEVPFVSPVSPLEGAPSGVRGRDAWPDERLHRNVRYRVDLMTTGIELVRQGLCAIFIPKFVADLYNEGISREFQIEPLSLPKKLGLVKRDVYIVKRQSMAEDKIFQNVAKALRKLS